MVGYVGYGYGTSASTKVFFKEHYYHKPNDEGTN